MTPDEKRLLQIQPQPPTGADSSAIQRQPSSALSQQISQPRTIPLPGNRPIADNSTEDIDDMLGYLD